MRRAVLTSKAPLFRPQDLQTTFEAKKAHDEATLMPVLSRQQSRLVGSRVVLEREPVRVNKGFKHRLLSVLVRQDFLKQLLADYGLRKVRGEREELTHELHFGTQVLCPTVRVETFW